MTGWRLGYAAVPAELVDPLTRLIVNSTSCVPPFAQLAGVEALEGPQDAVVEMVAEFRRRRDFLVPALNTIPGVRCIGPGGALRSRTCRSCRSVPTSSPTGCSTKQASPCSGDLIRRPWRRSSPHLVRLVAREPRAGGRAHPRLRRRVVGGRRGAVPRLGRCMPGFVDVHSHVVPAGDDGAATIEEGLELCRLAYEAGPRSCSRRRTRMLPGTTTRERPDATASMPSRSRRCAARSRPGGSTSGAAGRCTRVRSRGRSRRPRARRHPRGPDRVPGLVARHRGSDRRGRGGGRAGRGGWARARARPPGALSPRRRRSRERPSARRAGLDPVPQCTVARRRARRYPRAHLVGAARCRARRHCRLRRPHGRPAADPRRRLHLVRERRGDEIALPLFDGRLLPWT